MRFYQLGEFPQPGETRDELQYPWAGITLLNTGTPTSWSYFDSYENRQSIQFGKQEFRLVTPWFDKPLLYPLITGTWMKLNGINSIFDVNFFTLRLVPLGLSVITLLLIATITKRAFDQNIALLATLLYATIPSIVFANRLSLTENLLTPLVLTSIFFIQLSLKLGIMKGGTHEGSQTESHSVVPARIGGDYARSLGHARDTLPAKLVRIPLFKAILLGILSGLAFHTKQTGIVIALFVIGFYFWQRRLKELVITSAVFALFVVLHFAIVTRYDLKLYLNVMSDFRHGHTLVGLPELPFALFRFQGIGQQDRPFLDGSLLLGYLFLFTLPWWQHKQRVHATSSWKGNDLDRISKDAISTGWRIQHDERPTHFLHSTMIIFAPAFLYLLLLSIVESGATLFSFFGWHIYPLFPFVAIALAVGLYRAWQDQGILQFGVLFFFLGVSSIRLLFLLLPTTWHYRWQYGLIPLLMFMGIIQLAPDKLKQLGIKFLFGAYLGVNILTVLYASSWFPKLELPLF